MRSITAIVGFALSAALSARAAVAQPAAAAQLSADQLTRLATTIGNLRHAGLGDTTKINFCGARALWTGDTLTGPYAFKLLALHRTREHCERGKLADAQQLLGKYIYIDSVFARNDTTVALGRTVQRGVNGVFTIFERYISDSRSMKQGEYHITYLQHDHR